VSIRTEVKLLERDDRRLAEQREASEKGEDMKVRTGEKGDDLRK
jgi:hypothetical protein